MAEIKHTPQHNRRGPGIVFQSHVDFVHRKMKWKVEGDRIGGVLDNMLPSAILVSCLDKLKGQVVFTEDEETGMKHAQRVARRVFKDYPAPKGLHKWMGDRSWLPVVCVLEVDNVYDGADVIFENFVYFDANRIRKIMSGPSVRDIKYMVNGAGSWDETWRMAEAKLPAFSVCIPVTGDFHTYKATAALAIIDKYRRVILALDKALA